MFLAFPLFFIAMKVVVGTKVTLPTEVSSIMVSHIGLVQINSHLTLHRALYIPYSRFNLLGKALIAKNRCLV